MAKLDLHGRLVFSLPPSRLLVLLVIGIDSSPFALLGEQRSEEWRPVELGLHVPETVGRSERLGFIDGDDALQEGVLRRHERNVEMARLRLENELVENSQWAREAIGGHEDGGSFEMIEMSFQWEFVKM